MKTQAPMFGHQLRSIRLTKGLRAKAVAVAAGLSQPRLSAVESGRAPIPNESTIDRLTAALGCSPREKAGLIFCAHSQLLREQIDKVFDAPVRRDFVKSAAHAAASLDEAILGEVGEKLDAAVAARSALTAQPIGRPESPKRSEPM